VVCFCGNLNAHVEFIKPGNFVTSLVTAASQERGVQLIMTICMQK
jgi:hypothetical protein